jgi:hypothetical protein
VDPTGEVRLVGDGDGHVGQVDGLAGQQGDDAVEGLLYHRGWRGPLGPGDGPSEAPLGGALVGLGEGDAHDHLAPPGDGARPDGGGQERQAGSVHGGDPRSLTAGPPRNRF